MSETIDYLKTLPEGRSYPKESKCKICGFTGNLRFSDVCGSHDCRVKAGVCDCKACLKIKAKAELDEAIKSWDRPSLQNNS